MALTINNVAGNGHCCCWNLLRKDDVICDLIYLYDNMNETNGIQEIRDFVAIAIQTDYILHDMVS